MKEQNETLTWKRMLWYWGPVVIWMVIIFIGSSHSNVVLSESPSKDSLMKNLAHIGEYAILAFLIFRALYNREEKGFSGRYSYGWSGSRDGTVVWYNCIYLFIW